MKRVSLTRSGLLWILLLFAALFFISQSVDRGNAQRGPAVTETEVPSAQLFYVTRTPPCQWELNGLVAASDFVRLVFRRQEAWRDVSSAPRVLVFGREYQDRHFDLLTASDLLKIELRPEGPKQWSAPTSLVLMPNYNYLLPALVKNTTDQVKPLEIRTPFKSFRFYVPPRSVRGYALNLRTSETGKRRAEFVVHPRGSNSSPMLVPIEIDVRPRTFLKVRLREDGKAAAARVYLTGADGLSHTPLGSLQRILRNDGEYFFYARGEFEVVVPAGRTTIEAVRGLEYEPVQTEVTLSAGETKAVDLSLDHRFPIYERNYYSGDSHIHANYVNNEIIDLDDIELQVDAEGLDNANLMVANSSDAVVHDQRFFEGKPNARSGGHKTLYWNEEMRNRGVYGHMSFFNLKELVHPLFTGFPGTQHWEDYPPNYEQARKAQEQNGAVAYVHPARGPSFDMASFKEFPVDLALGQIDTLDVMSNSQEVPSMTLWYRALNCGFRCGISAGTDSFTNLMMHWLPGGHRVYVHVPGEFTYQKWIDGYKAGKSFASNGPMLRFTVNGNGPGEDLRWNGASTEVKVAAVAHSIVPMDKLEVVLNGEVVATEQVSGGTTELRIERTIPLSRSSWLAARVSGPSHRMVVNDDRVFAHSSPVYCYRGDDPITSAADAAFWSDWIDQLIELVAQRGNFATPDKRESVIKLFRRAQDIYKKQVTIAD